MNLAVIVGEVGVPAQDLTAFRTWREHARQAHSLGRLLTELEEQELAAAAEQIAKTLRAKADSFRVECRE